MAASVVLCPICFETLRDPVLLECPTPHTLCREPCALGIWKIAAARCQPTEPVPITCPLCRYQTVVPAGAGVSTLRRNLAVAKLVDARPRAAPACVPSGASAKTHGKELDMLCLVENEPMTVGIETRMDSRTNASRFRTRLCVCRENCLLRVSASLLDQVARIADQKDSWLAQHEAALQVEAGAAAECQAAIAQVAASDDLVACTSYSPLSGKIYTLLHDPRATPETPCCDAVLEVKVDVETECARMASVGVVEPVKLNPAKAFQAARGEFREFSIPELKEFENMFRKYDRNGDGVLDLEELKYMMEHLQMPQTHLGLKAMIKEVDEDTDGVINYREFLLIFRYAKTGKLHSEGLKAIAASIDVSAAGVGGAKGFFEAKAAELNDSVSEKDREYREQVKKEREAKAASRAAFKEKASAFQ
eukprot:m51a1_g5514 hypothetical protein (420) ;mRNA; r:394800-396978